MAPEKLYKKCYLATKLYYLAHKSNDEKAIQHYDILAYKYSTRYRAVLRQLKILNEA